jgi:hypothetical protein
MPRFKTPDYGLKLIPVDFARQVLPGTFEFALCHLVDNDLDLSTLRARYTNDAGGAPVFDPAVLPSSGRRLVAWDSSRLIVFDGGGIHGTDGPMGHTGHAPFAGRDACHAGS